MISIIFLHFPFSNFVFEPFWIHLDRLPSIIRDGITYGKTEFWQYFDRLVTEQESNLSNIETISEVSVLAFE